MKQRIGGMDTIRFFCALWVIFGHLGFIPLPQGFCEEGQGAVCWIFLNAYKSLFSGPAAVIVFFVISGFCVHYTACDTPRSGWPTYYLRRYLRIGLPVLAAVLFSNLFNLTYVLYYNSIVWSLIAELIYYTLYPALLFLRKRWGWPALLGAAFAAAGLVILRDPSALNYPAHGPVFTWLLGLPCWLLGVHLAETFDNPSRGETKAGPIWVWRIGVWLLSSVCMILRFRTPIGYPITLNLFAIVVYFWLRQEVLEAQTRPPKPFFEGLGSWSYSIYLMHMIALKFMEPLISPEFYPGLRWVFLLLFSLGVSYVFFLVVEAPSHAFAKKAARWRG